MDNTEAIRDYYNGDVESEWKRIENRPEFLITCRFLDRYVKPGDRVLDIGGGPGRYALRLARQGCDVTLLDLSPVNVRFAMEKAAEQGVSIHAVEGDARAADDAVTGHFDHVLLMGPMYHLQAEGDRAKAVGASLRLLKPGGVLYVSFISLYAGLIYAMKRAPEIVIDPDHDSPQYLRTVLDNQSYTGNAFTHAHFIHARDVLPFMAQFPLSKLHFIGQESITSPCEGNIMSQPSDVVDAWLDLCEILAEREELINWSEHLMYIGRKT